MCNSCGYSKNIYYLSHHLKTINESLESSLNKFEKIKVELHLAPTETSIKRLSIGLSAGDLPCLQALSAIAAY